MYTLMNKDTPLIDFDFITSEITVEENIQEIKVYSRPWFIPDLKTWLKHRRAPRSRTNIEALFRTLSIHKTRQFVEYTKGISLTDTLWINCDDRYTWKQINLFDNPFDDIIAQVAFDGLYRGLPTAALSPEFTTDGMFAKCWVRESDDNIYLIKQGSSGASNAGLEPYSEQYCSEILDILGYNHVQYEVVQYRGKIASKCKLLTSKSQMMLPIAQCLEDYEFKAITQYCEEHNALTSLYEMIVLDYLVTNDDRHLNNVGIVMDADTFEIQGLAPIYDNGGGLLPYAVADNMQSYKSLCQYAFIKSPRFYSDFFPQANWAKSKINSSSVRKLLSFKFRRDYDYALPEERLLALEDYVQNQAKCLLDGIDPLENVAP